MNQPTKEQEQWFWEQCEFLYGEPSEKTVTYPDGMEYYPPFLDLNNLFKYAVPKLKIEYQNKLKHIGFGSYKKILYEWVNELTGNYEEDALALFWAIYKAWGGE